MAINYGQIRASVFKLLDEFSSRGSLQAANKTADYNFKCQSLVNESIMELASTNAKLPKTFLIAHNPIKNTLSDDNGTLEQYLPGTDFSITLVNARAVSFEVARFGEIALEESSNGVDYTTIEVITVPSSTEGFTEYKRLITPTLPTNTVRLRFTGNFSYLFRNFVLYEFSFPTEADIPQHGPIFTINPPDDFLDFNYAEINRGNGEYISYDEMLKTPENQLTYNGYENPCEILVRYWRKPTLLTFANVTVADDAMLIDLRDDASLIIPYYCAGEIQNSEESGRGESNLRKYNEKRSVLIPVKGTRSESVRNTSNW